MIDFDVHSILAQKLSEQLDFLKEGILSEDFLFEVAFKRVVRGGKIIRKVKKKQGFRAVRKGGNVRFVRMTVKEKRIRRISARKAWRKGKAARVTKSKRSVRKSKARMNTLYGHKGKK